MVSTEGLVQNLCQNNQNSSSSSSNNTHCSAATKLALIQFSIQETHLLVLTTSSGFENWLTSDEAISETFLCISLIHCVLDSGPYCLLILVTDHFSGAVGWKSRGRTGWYIFLQISNRISTQLQIFHRGGSKFQLCPWICPKSCFSPPILHICTEIFRQKDFPTAQNLGGGVIALCHNATESYNECTVLGEAISRHTPKLPTGWQRCHGDSCRAQPQHAGIRARGNQWLQRHRQRHRNHLHRENGCLMGVLCFLHTKAATAFSVS